MKEMETRRSIRSYIDKDVSEETVTALLQAARLAPSGKNLQPWRFLVIRDRAKREAIAKADHNQGWMTQAPVLIACLADPSVRKPDIGGVVANEDCALPELKPVLRDTAIAIEHILLEAERLGVGVCWTGWYSQAEMRKVLGTPEYMYIAGVLSVGYAAESPAPRPRRPLEELVCYEVFKA